MASLHIRLFVGLLRPNNSFHSLFHAHHYSITLIKWMPSVWPRFSISTPGCQLDASVRYIIVCYFAYTQAHSLISQLITKRQIQTDRCSQRCKCSEVKCLGWQIGCCCEQKAMDNWFSYNQWKKMWDWCLILPERCCLFQLAVDLKDPQEA